MTIWYDDPTSLCSMPRAHTLQVFIGKDCIKEMVAAKVAHPEHFMISANVINNPALSWVHYHQDAVLPYLPELVQRPRNDTPSWRASKLPIWQDAALFDRRQKMDPPFQGHRWLPLPPGYTLDGTPITTTEYDALGFGWWNWALGAQEHYSFLDHLERDNLKVYDFGTWDYHYGHLSINMLAFWGDDIVDNYPFSPDWNDETWLTELLPEKLGRRKYRVAEPLTLADDLPRYCDAWKSSRGPL